MTEWVFECPDGWEILSRWGDGYAVREKSGGLRVLIDCETKADGNRWLHVSVSRSDRIPGHRDMAEVKQAFIGDRYAYAVWPPTGSYVNIHPNCLHLWSLWNAGDGRVLPEFSKVLAGIGRSV